MDSLALSLSLCVSASVLFLKLRLMLAVAATSICDIKGTGFVAGIMALVLAKTALSTSTYVQ